MAIENRQYEILHQIRASPVVIQATASCQGWFLKSGLGKLGSACERECKVLAESRSGNLCANDCNALCQPLNCDEPPDNQCLFYRSCLESSSACGANGYALGYGEKYCLRFLQNSKFSKSGMDWRRATMTCLQKSLVPAFNWTNDRNVCPRIMKAAFQNHVSCYTQEPNSICHLSLNDWRLVSTEILLLKDLLSPRGLKQSLKVAFGKCRAPLIEKWRIGKDKKVRSKLEYLDQIEDEAEPPTSRHF